MNLQPRRALALAVTLVAAVALAACGPGAEPSAAPSATQEPAQAARPSPLTVTDGLGRTITLSMPADRIVSIAPSNTEILFAIGAGGLLVGRDEYSDYPAEALDVASIGDVYSRLDLEAVVALQPDLVLAAGITPAEQIQSLEAVGIMVFALGNPADFPGLFDNIVAAGMLTGHEAEASALTGDLAKRVDSIAAAVVDAEPISVFYEIDGTDPSAPWTTGSGTFQHMLFELARGENVAADIHGWGQISLEELVTRDPKVIIFGAGPFVPTTVESLSARPGWGDISAVKSGRVYAVDTDWTDLPGPRLVDGLEAIASILHPDRLHE